MVKGGIFWVVGVLGFVWFVSPAQSEGDRSETDFIKAKAAAAELRFIGSTLRGHSPLNQMVGLLDTAESSLGIVRIAHCVGAGCQWGQELSTFFVERLMREILLTISHRLVLQPGIPILNSQVDLEPLQSFIAQLVLLQNIGKAPGQEIALAKDFVAVSRQLCGLGLTFGGVALRDELVDEILSAFPDRTFLKATLRDIQRFVASGHFSEAQRSEARQTQTLLESRSSVPARGTGPFTLGFVHGITVAQYYVFLPIFATQTMRHLGICPRSNDFCLTAVNRALVPLRNVFIQWDGAWSDFYTQYQSDLARRFPATVIRHETIWERFRRDYDRRFPAVPDGLCARAITQARRN